MYSQEVKGDQEEIWPKGEVGEKEESIPERVKRRQVDGEERVKEEGGLGEGQKGQDVPQP